METVHLHHVPPLPESWQPSRGRLWKRLQRNSKKLAMVVAAEQRPAMETQCPDEDAQPDGRGSRAEAGYGN